MNLNFKIEVHIDDIETLYKIGETLGIGKVNKSNTRTSAKYCVNDFKDITSVLIPIFKEFPLQTTKYLDFTSFMNAAALIKLNSKGSYRGGRISYNNISDSDMVKLKKLKEFMNSGRSFIEPEEAKLLKDKVSINK